MALCVSRFGGREAVQEGVLVETRGVQLARKETSCSLQTGEGGGGAIFRSLCVPGQIGCLWWVLVLMNCFQKATFGEKNVTGGVK